MYVTVDDVRAALDPETLNALFDDANAGAVADANPALQRAMKSAHAEVTSNLAPEMGRGMPSDLPDAVSQILVAAELAYTLFFAFSRKPALAKKISEEYLKELWTFAEKRMDRLHNAIQEIAPSDNPPPKKPANVGGLFVDNGVRVYVDNADGSRNSGDY